MKIQLFLGIICSLAVMALSGCGGGGGGGSTPPTVVTGMAAKGLFVSGAVKVYGIDPVTAAKGSLLRTTALDALGTYSADITPYTGPILIEVTGRYKDEATGLEVDLDPATPLRAAISNATGTVQVMVTPLTELAVRKAGAVLTKTVIDTMNANIAALFQLEDITKTKPVDAANAASATATAAEQNQALVLAAISQLVANSPGKTLGQVLGDLAADISGATMADRSIAGYKEALFDFMTGPNNKSGITSLAATPVNIGSFKLAHIKISTQGTLPAGVLIGGIDFTVTLPSGVTISADATSKLVSPGLVVISGVATTGSSISLATFNQPDVRTVLANANGFGVGEFVDIGCTIPAGSTVTAENLATAVSTAPFTASNLTGAHITGLTLKANVDIF